MAGAFSTADLLAMMEEKRRQRLLRDLMREQDPEAYAAGAETGVSPEEGEMAQEAYLAGILDPLGIPSALSGLVSPEYRDDWRETQGRHSAGMVGQAITSAPALGAVPTSIGGAFMGGGLAAGSDIIDRVAGDENAIDEETLYKGMGGAALAAPIRYGLGVAGGAIGGGAAYDAAFANPRGGLPPGATVQPPDAGTIPLPGQRPPPQPPPSAAPPPMTEAPPAEPQAAPEPPQPPGFLDSLYNSLPSAQGIYDSLPNVSLPDMGGLSGIPDQIGGMFANKSFEPMSYEEFAAERVGPPPTLNEYISEARREANEANAEARAKGIVTATQKAVEKAVADARKNFPRVMEDYENRKRLVRDEYDQYKRDVAQQREDYYKSDFRERNPGLNAGINVASYVAPAVIASKGFSSVTKKTDDMLAALKQARGKMDPEAEAVAARALRNRMVMDPTYKALIAGQAVATPTELRLAGDMWDAKTMPSDTEGYKKAMDNVSFSKVMEGLPTNLLTGALSTGAGLLHTRMGSRGKASAELQRYRDPDGYRGELETINATRRARADAANEAREIKLLDDGSEANFKAGQKAIAGGQAPQQQALPPPQGGGGPGAAQNKAGANNAGGNAPPPQGNAGQNAPQGGQQASPKPPKPQGNYTQGDRDFVRGVLGDMIERGVDLMKINASTIAKILNEGRNRKNAIPVRRIKERLAATKDYVRSEVKGKLTRADIDRMPEEWKGRKLLSAAALGGLAASQAGDAADSVLRDLERGRKVRSRGEGASYSDVLREWMRGGR